MGPRGLPLEIVQRLNEAFNEAMALPAVREKLAADLLEPVGGTPEEFRRFFAAEVVKWRKIAAELGVKTQWRARRCTTSSSTSDRRRWRGAAP